jgi:hypothetical protein
MVPGIKVKSQMGVVWLHPGKRARTRSAHKPSATKGMVDNRVHKHLGQIYIAWKVSSQPATPMQMHAP